MRRSIALLLGLTVTVTATAAARRWGVEGHRVVARVAQSRLTPRALAEARRLLGGQNLEDVSTWADDIRRGRPATAPWHYVDIELSDSTYVESRDCPKGDCAVDVINHELAILADRTRSDSARAEALRWVIHLVGDIHQPLHGSDDHDKGGNDVHVVYRGNSVNLHSLWDTGLPRTLGDEDAIVARIDRELAHRTDLDAIAESTPVQWAMESHDIAKRMVYGMLPPSHQLDSAYVATAQGVIVERLLRGGVRLTAVLDRALDH
jgi:nuclease S1